MADRNLIAGAAALAQSQAAKSLGFGAGLVQEAARIQQDIAQKTNERRAVLRQDMNNAANFITRMASLDKVSGQYHAVLTKEAQATRDALNKIAIDKTLSSSEKIAEYSRLTDEYNALAAGFGADQGKLSQFQANIAQGLTSETLNLADEDTAIARGLGTGNYEITKDGYNVSYDINGESKKMLVKSPDVDKYINKYSLKNIEGLSTLQDSYIKEIANAKGDPELERLIQARYEQLNVDNKVRLLVDLNGKAYDNYIDQKTGELLVDVVNSDFSNYAKNLTNEFGYKISKTEKADMLGDMLTNSAENAIRNMYNLDSYVGLKYANTPILAMSLETAEGEDFGKIRITQRVGGQNIVTYRNSDDIDFLRDMFTKKMLNQVEGKDERNKARVIANTYFDAFLEQIEEDKQENIKDIQNIYDNNGINSLTENQKIFINENKESFPNIIKDQENLITKEKEATNIKLSKPQKERLKTNWLVKVENGEFDKYLQDNNILKEGAINKSTGMVKSEIVNRPDFKETFGDKYPANIYKDGSKLFGTMQSEFYGKDFVRTPGGKFTKRTKTEVQKEIQTRKEELLNKSDKADRVKYFKNSANDLSAYDQLAENNENIPKLSVEDFESFIDTGKLDDKYINIILNNENKFSSTLIDLITKEF